MAEPGTSWVARTVGSPAAYCSVPGARAACTCTQLPRAPRQPARLPLHRDNQRTGLLQATLGYRYRKRSRTVCEQAGESYLRVDISCGSAACPACRPTLPALGAGADHYVIPDARVLEDFLEVFEAPDLANVVFLTSVMRPLLEGGNMRRSARLRALYSDKRRHCYLFDNLHCLDTAAASGPGAAAAGLDLLAAADWYYEHLGSRLAMVVVSDALAAKLGSAPSAEPTTTSARDAAAAAAAAPAPAPTGGAGAAGAGSSGLPAAGAAAGEDAELEALLRQLDINPQPTSSSSGGGGWGPAAAPSTARPPSSLAAAGARGQEADMEAHALLETLGLGLGAAAPPAAQQGSAAAAAAAAAELGEAPGPLPPGVHVLSTAQYFARYYGANPAVWDLYESQAQSLAEEVQGGAASAGSGYAPHLSTAAVDAGLSQGTLLQGVLSMSRRAMHEGTVRVGGGLEGGARHVLICGKAALNRAVQGDTVAVRLLPRERWRPAPLGTDPGEEDEDLMPDAEEGAEEAEGATAEDLLNDSAAGGAQPTGEVVAVLARAAGEIVAAIAEEDERALEAKGDTGRQEAVLCIPLDRRLPKVRLRSRQLHRLLGCRLVVRIDGWERGSNYPHGHLLRVLGPVNDLTAETDAVLVSSGVHWQPFTEGALRELPQVASAQDWAIPPSELATRRDLRGPEHFICSIDPPGCTDVDDALGVRWLGDGLVEVGVHIADVSYFVRQGSLLDAEAASRCTTVYLVDRRLDMLPALLSEQLCSLRGGQDRLAMSCVWVLREADLGVESVWCGRTLIRSRYQLEYQQAQDVMDDRPPRPGHEIAPADRPTLQRVLRFLARLADARRRGRLAAGAVELESAELRFQTNSEGQPVKVDVKQEIPMMRIVAEMMIFANAAVGERIYRTFPRAALLRRHPPPRREGFAEVIPLCESVGVELDFSTNAALSASLEAACAAAPPAMATLIKSLTTRAMSEAEYFCTGDVMGRGAGMSHFGLALPFYTHFTSPIRRYADVVAHRQLLAAVAAGGHLLRGADLAPPPDLAVALQQAPPPLPPGEVSTRAAVMNERHRTAKRAQKSCSDLYLLLLLHKEAHVEAATVYGIRAGPRGTALLVFVPKYHIKGAVHLTDRAGMAKPPLRQPGDEQLDDPFVLAYRRGLAVVADPGTTGDKCEGVSLVEAASGTTLACYRPLQRVWVKLGADGSRAHGPALRMRLLADSHPAALEALRQGKGQEADAEPAASPLQRAEQGCGALPRGMPRPGSYRPPGLKLGGGSDGSSGAAAVRTPSPGFPAVAGAGAQLPCAQSLGEPAEPSAAGWPAAEGGHEPGPGREDGSSAATLTAAPDLPPEGRELPRVGQLHIEAPRTAVAERAAGGARTGDARLQGGGRGGSSGGSGSGTGPPIPPADAGVAELLQAAVRRLRARASRYALRAAKGDPAGAAAREWELKAGSCRAQLAALEAQLAACRAA